MTQNITLDTAALCRSCFHNVLQSQTRPPHRGRRLHYAASCTNMPYSVLGQHHNSEGQLTTLQAKSASVLDQSSNERLSGSQY